MSDTAHPKQPTQRITPRALLELKKLGEIQLHPDGRRVAFTVTEADFEDSVWVTHIWLTEWNPPEPEAEGETSESASPASEESKEAEPTDWTRQLTYSHEGETSPRWSPNGEQLAFLSTRPDLAATDDDDNTEAQVWTLPIDGGEARKLTSAPEGVIDFAWTPDSESILYLTPEPRPRPVESKRKEERNTQHIDPTVEHEEFLRRQFWSIAVGGAKPKYLGAVLPGTEEFALSPDGERLTYITNYTGDANDYHAVDIYLRDLKTGGDFKLLKRHGIKFQALWAHDGKHLAFRTPLEPKHTFSQETLFVCEIPDVLPEGYKCLYNAEAEGITEAYAPAQPDNDLLDYQWSAEEGKILALCAVGVDTELFTITLRGEYQHIDVERCRDRSSLSAAREGGAYAFLQESHEQLPEVYLQTTEGELQQLTHLHKEFAETYHTPHHEVVRWQSADGLTIEGVLITPVECKKGSPAPLIVQVHGGPKGRVTRSLRNYYMSPLWASEGYAVLLPNFRGSEGYGNSFVTANFRDIGGGDFADIMAGVDYCIAKGVADAEHLGIMGGSYGGFMTNWAIGHTNRFRAAISMFGIFNLQTDYSNSDFPHWDKDYLGGWYWEDPDIYRKLSPGSYVEHINTPTLILHGDDDNNTFISNSKEMYQALRHRGVTTQFVHYPREGHGVREPNHKMDEMRRCLAWMDRHLLAHGKEPSAYRLNDRVGSADGLRELCVLRCEPATLEGQPAATKETLYTLWEIEFTLHFRDKDANRPALCFPLTHVRMEPSADGETLTPIGVPLKAMGGVLLLEGENLHFTIEPNAKTGELSFGCVAILRLPKAGGTYSVRIADFAPVIVDIPRFSDEEGEGM